jgi:hypothetical protein
MGPPSKPYWILTMPATAFPFSNPAPLPAFLPYRVAHEVTQNFPLVMCDVKQPIDNTYMVIVQSGREHPIYEQVKFALRVDMDRVESIYNDDIDIFIEELVEGLIERMVRQIKPGVSEGSLKEFAPWMFANDPHEQTST